MSQVFASDDQNTGVSASVSVLPMSIQGWFPLRLLWSLCCPKDSQESSPAPQSEGIFSTLPFLTVQHSIVEYHHPVYYSLPSWSQTVTFLPLLPKTAQKPHSVKLKSQEPHDLYQIQMWLFLLWRPMNWKTNYWYPITYTREGDGTPLQYSCLESPRDGGAWWAAVHGVAKSRTRLSDFPFTFHFHALEKEMATHSSVLAWRIPGTGKPGGLPSVGLHRVRHDWSDWSGMIANGYFRSKLSNVFWHILIAFNDSFSLSFHPWFSF